MSIFFCFVLYMNIEQICPSWLKLIHKKLSIEPGTVYWQLLVILVNIFSVWCWSWRIDWISPVTDRPLVTVMNHSHPQPSISLSHCTLKLTPDKVINIHNMRERFSPEMWSARRTFPSLLHIIPASGNLVAFSLKFVFVSKAMQRNCFGYL